MTVRPVSATQSPLVRRDRRGLDERAVDGRHQEAGAVERRPVVEDVRDDRDAGVVDRRQRERGIGRNLGQQPRGRRSGGGDDDRVDVDRLDVGRRADREPPAVSRTGDLADGRVESHLDARRRRRRGSWPTPPTSPANTGPDAVASARALAAPASRSRAERGDLRRRRLQRELVGVTGVDATEQRLDEPVDDVGAEPSGDELGDRHVTVGHVDDMRIDLGDAVELSRSPGCP